MVCLIILLLLVPGMLTWKIADGREPGGFKEFAVYTAFYVLKGPVSISFCAAWPNEDAYYSIYDIGFVFQYSALALLCATGLGALERLVGRLIGRKTDGLKK